MVFVTGGSGLLGSHLIAFLLQSGEDRIVALKRSSSDLFWFKRILGLYGIEESQLIDKLRWVDGDLMDFALLDEWIQKDMEVYHAAGLVSFQKGMEEELWNANVQATSDLIDICVKKQVRKFCHVSSIAALGRAEAGETTITENSYRTTTKGSSFYSATKYEAEMEVWRGIAEGLHAVIVNPSVILGEGDFSKGSNELIRTVYKGLKFFTRGVNGYVDVRDVVRAMYLLMKSEQSSERFLLSAENWSYEQLFKTIAKYLKVKGPKYYANPFMGAIAWRLLAIYGFVSGHQPMITRDTARNAKAIFHYDASKIKERLDFSFTSLEETLIRSCALFLKVEQD